MSQLYPFSGYAMSMNVGQNDVLENVAKVVPVILRWIQKRRDFIANENERIARLKELKGYEGENLEFHVLRSPTLREILQYEIDTDLHDGKLPTLKEESAAMGLLWIKRHFQYQLINYSNMRSGKYDTASKAVAAGYKETYDNYHSWAVQKIFHFTIYNMPDSKEMYKTMNPRYFRQLSLESRASSSSLEEDDFSQSSQDTDYEEEILEQRVVDKLNIETHRQMSEMLKVCRPILEDLSGLFDEMNMNDPKRV